MTLETLLDEIHDRGWYLYTLGMEGLHWSPHFQWHCTLRFEAGPASRIARGEGHTAIEALSLAIDSMENAEVEIIKPATFSIESKPDLTSILSNLRKNIPPIKRRI